MTPDQLDIILTDSRVLTESPDEFAIAFYDTLFELAPETRRLFAADMTAQRAKLTDELIALVEIATAWQRAGAMPELVTRASDLGARHRDYGVTTAMYAQVGIALIAALRSCLDGFDEAHEVAWSTLYRVVAATMQEGALR